RAVSWNVPVAFRSRAHRQIIAPALKAAGLSRRPQSRGFFGEPEHLRGPGKGRAQTVLEGPGRIEFISRNVGPKTCRGEIFDGSMEPEVLKLMPAAMAQLPAFS